MRAMRKRLDNRGMQSCPGPETIPDTSCTGCTTHPKCELLFPDAASGFYWGKRASDVSPYVTLDFDNGDVRTVQGEELADSIRAGARCVRHF